jgi:Concanavalin A-like lectin/glucanases superfamily
MSASFDPKFISFSKSGGSSTLLTGLMAFWKLDESSGNAADASGNGITGTSSNISYGAGKLNNCYTFNGTSSKVALGNVCAPTTGLTLSGWIKTTNVTTNSPILNCIIDDTNFEGYYLVGYNDGGMGFFMGNNTGSYADLSYHPFSINDGSWHHIVGTWNGSNAYMYVDGNKSSVNSFASPIVYNASNSLNIGYDAKNSGWTNGSIDEVGIWSRALTDAEVATLYNSGSAKAYPFS